MQKAVGYHGTRPEHANKILEEGFRLDAPLRSDAGDLGRGVYLYPTLREAKLSPAILEVTVEGNFLTLVPPKLYETIDFLRLTLGCTIHNPPEKRIEAAWSWRAYFLEQGYDGLLVKGWDTPAKTRGYEIVVFDLGAIKQVRIVWTKKRL